MRKSICSLALSAALAVVGSSAFAQSDNSTQQPSIQAPMGHHGMDPEKQAAELTKKLNLSAEQESQIKPILVNRQQQMEAMHQDPSMSQQDRMTKMNSLRDDSNSKIEAVLNDTQKQQFEAMQAHQQQRWQQPHQQ
jgi:Spy/CpxP family protein refolding chaperone